MTGVYDSFQRPLKYLRVSVTDRCNLHCFYCVPQAHFTSWPQENFLSYEEIVTIVRACANLGITKVRLTGGEPLVRAGITKLVAQIAQIETVDDLALTTNGLLLASLASELKTSGLKRVNVSLDSLRPERLHRITGQNCFRRVMAGIEAAKKVGLDPVKINMVVMRGINDDEVVDLARLTITEGWHVRFIELMPFGQAEASQFISLEEIRQRLSALGELEAVFDVQGDGPARYFRFPGAKGSIGLITPISQDFCAQCNRLRLTADGRLKPCLMGDEEVDLRTPLRSGASLEEIEGIIQEAAAIKPQSHCLAQGVTPTETAMFRMGG
ncbi:MAG: GTP 3',8-cyclase MoaA [Chloroflexota bacterium]